VGTYREPEADDMLTYELWLAVMQYFQPFASQPAPGSTALAVSELDAARETPVRLQIAGVGRVANEAGDAMRGVLSVVKTYRESTP
jgi:hypothetical protein